MNNVEQKESRAKIVTQIIVEKGGNYEIAKSLIDNNPSLLEFNEEELRKHIFLIMNHDIVYAVLFIVDNDLFWTVLDRNKCGLLIKNDSSALDYVILLMLESIRKYEQLTPHDEKPSLEEAINEYNLVKKNEESYHIK